MDIRKTPDSFDSATPREQDYSARLLPPSNSFKATPLTLEEMQANAVKEIELAEKPQTIDLDFVENILKDIGDDNTPNSNNDAAVKALAALTKVKQRNKIKRIKFWAGWLFFFMLLTGIIAGAYFWLQTKVVVGHYTIPHECKVVVGNVELTGKRYFTYGYKSILGYRLVNEQVVFEKTELDIRGEKMTILGSDKDKPWRKLIATGDRSTDKLKNSDTYWFVTDKAFTMITHKDLCK